MPPPDVQVSDEAPDIAPYADHDLPPEPPQPAAEDEELDDSGGKMSFLEHLDELRKRLLVSVIAIAAGFVIALSFIAKIFEFIMRPLYAVLPRGSTFIYTEPAEVFMLYMKAAALVGLFLAAPLVLWQLWLFIAPGLYAHEKRYAIPFVVLSTVCFMAGALFSHYMVFPWTWKFFAGFSTDYMQFTPKVSPTFALYTKLLLAFGLVFQMPTLVYFLARMGVVTHRWLMRQFKFAVLIIFIAAAILTPGPDVVSQSLMAGPMVLLYLISIVIAWVFAKKPSV